MFLDVEVLAAERVHYDVVAREYFGEVLFPVVHDHFRAETAHQLGVLGTRGRCHRGAEVFGELDDGRSQAAGAGVDQDPLPRLEVGAVDEDLPGGQ